MGPILLSLYLVLVGLATAQAALMALQAWEHHRFARSRLRTLDRVHQSGRAIVFAPCKGVDVDIEENLGRLFHQDYHDYEIAFIVESESDPACPTIRRLMAENARVASRLVIAGRADDSGQKVHNLCVATGEVGPNIEFLVFVDSDAPSTARVAPRAGDPIGRPLPSHHRRGHWLPMVSFPRGPPWPTICFTASIRASRRCLDQKARIRSGAALGRFAANCLKPSVSANNGKAR